MYGPYLAGKEIEHLLNCGRWREHFAKITHPVARLNQTLFCCVKCIGQELFSLY